MTVVAAVVAGLAAAAGLIAFLLVPERSMRSAGLTADEEPAEPDGEQTEANEEL
ncbi:MAG: hypothetical protein QOC59_1599 [Microbacteriaceae bacterium]|jgi:hypothetical protein|nr:hypothetical protein [Microbacteriaceae bacterium]